MAPKFVAAAPDDVAVGRGKTRQAAVRVYAEGIIDEEAGIITLEDEDGTPSTARRYLHEAAKSLDMKIRVSVDEEARTLTWKTVGK